MEAPVSEQRVAPDSGHIVEERWTPGTPGVIPAPDQIPAAEPPSGGGDGPTPEPSSRGRATKPTPATKAEDTDEKETA